jgi:ubiquinone/menaquinone biosynthesis C-methylase UbiE
MDTMNTSSVKDNYQAVSVARAYDRERFSSLVGRTFDKLEKRAIRKVIGRALPDVGSAQVLDIPCGTGRVTELLLGIGLEVMGGDISPAMMEVAQEKCTQFGSRATFRRLDLDGLDLPVGSFDLVSCIRLFHHLDTAARGRILRELARVSRRYVLVNVSLSTAFLRLRRWLKRLLRQGISTTSSTWDDIRQEADGAGLKLVARTFVLPFVSEDVVLLFEKR